MSPTFCYIIYNIFMKKCYAAIDLKSFFASVECCARTLDPLTTNLVVADETRTEKTICLAISPALKSYGLGGRARLFEVLEKVRQINYDRRKFTPNHTFAGKSCNASELAKHPEYALDFIIAKPRMQLYLDYSKKIYDIYLKFIAPTDIFAYSIDEVFCDISSYLKFRHYSPQEFITKIVSSIYAETGITATAGIGTNMYLAKVAMDIVAKHAEPNNFGVRIAKLDESSYRKQLWHHQPITDFWRVGPGYAKRLATHQMFTMGDVARCSLIDEDLLFRLFGVNAELLIDHAWGIEPTEISDVKSYQPTAKSISNGQVLQSPYDIKKVGIIVKEMAQELALDLSHKGYISNSFTLHISYDVSSLENYSAAELASINTKTDRYGRLRPKSARGTIRCAKPSNLASTICEQFNQLYQRIVNPKFLVRKLTLSANDLQSTVIVNARPEQLNLFNTNRTYIHDNPSSREQQLQKAILEIRQRYGSNAILKGTNFENGATGRQRNRRIGGHNA